MLTTQEGLRRVQAGAARLRPTSAAIQRNRAPSFTVETIASDCVHAPATMAECVSRIVQRRL